MIQTTIRTTIRRTFRRAVPVALGAALLCMALPEPTPGQQPIGAGAQTGPAPASDARPAPAAKATLADFAWLAGRWQGVWGPRIVQQVWVPPRAGVMLGTFQIAENDKTLVIELCTLVEKPEGIELRLRHFTPSLVAWEKSGPAVLKFTSADPITIVFENPSDGEPKRAVLQRIDADAYVWRSEIVTEKGEMQVTEITYRRQKESPPSRRR